MTPTRALAERIAGTQYADIPAPARMVAKQALLDFIGVTMAGIDEPLARMLRDQVSEEGGHPQAQLIGTDERASTTQAALVNGSAGHAHDYDDVHTAMTGHPTVPVAPAVLASPSDWVGPEKRPSLRSAQAWTRSASWATTPGPITTLMAGTPPEPWAASEPRPRRPA